MDKKMAEQAKERVIRRTASEKNIFPAFIGQEVGLSGSALKIIAIVCMVIDHIAWGFVETSSIPGILMHTIGRITAPVMCFMLVEGYRHTHSFKRYAIRLAVFAVISYVPFIFFEYGELPSAATALSLNMIYTLFISLLALWADEHLKKSNRITALILLGVLSLLGDWSILAFCFVLTFAHFRENRSRLLLIMFMISATYTLLAVYGYIQAGFNLEYALRSNIFQLGTVLALPLIDRYNGKKGNNFGGKWFFYWFYPVHLVVLGVLQLMLP